LSLSQEGFSYIFQCHLTGLRKLIELIELNLNKLVELVEQSV